MKKSKWQEIHTVLRNKILSGELKPGQEFPTNFQLMKEFNAHAATIQNAVNALINEGLIFSAGSSGQRRLVRPLPFRSTRRGGFSTEHGDEGRKEIIRLEILHDAKDLPAPVRNEMQSPVLLYHTRQWRGDLVVAVSRSFIPNRLPLDELHRALTGTSEGLYAIMKKYGFHPASCEESLIASIPTQEEIAQLDLPKLTHIPVVRITRKVFDPEGNLLEFCLLTDRADCYEFTYRFSL